jgi:hypothetical protein
MKQQRPTGIGCDDLLGRNMRKLNTKEAVKQLDSDVLKELETMRKRGRTFARAGEVARRMSCNSVQALGAMERVKNHL